MKSVFSSICLILLCCLFFDDLSAQTGKFKFRNSECSSFSPESGLYEWYGDSKGGLADGYGIMLKDTIVDAYNKRKIYKSAFFNEGIMMKDSELIGQDLAIACKYDTTMERDLYCQTREYYSDHVYNNNCNTDLAIEYNTNDKIYWLYALAGKRSRPHFQLKIFDKVSMQFIRYGQDCSGNTFYEQKTIDGSWGKTIDASLSLTKPSRLESDIQQMLNAAIKTNNPVLVYILLSQLSKTYGEHDLPFDEYDYIKTEFKPKYATLLETAMTWAISPASYDFLQILRPDFLKNYLDKNLSNYQNLEDARKASEFGVTIRYTFNKEIIGKRYVPPITKNYTVTIDKFYINDQEIKVTQDKTSTSGGYDEERTGYIAIYQLINASDDYLIVPITITGSALITEQFVHQTGFFNNTTVRSNIPRKNSFEVKKAFLLEPRTSVKEQLVTGEEVPSDFRISAPKIIKVDINWVNKLQKALSGDLSALEQMLADSKASYWSEQLKSEYNTALKKSFGSLLDISVFPANKTIFDPDFESEVKVVVTNRTTKNLEVSFSTSFKKNGLILIKPNSQEISVFKIKGYSSDSLEATITKIAVSTSNDLNTVKDIEGNIYKVTIISDQAWMAENIRTTKYVDGTPINLVTNDSVWAKLKSPAYCWLNNDEITNKNYGALYNKYVVETNNVCPVGWHIPTSEDWKLLTANIDNNASTLKSNAAIKWLPPSDSFKDNVVNVTNEYNFNAIPVGRRSESGKFDHQGEYFTIWSSSRATYDASRNNALSLNNCINLVFSPGPEASNNGYSIRCIKD